MPKQVGPYKCVVAFYSAGQEFDWMANTYRLPHPILIDGVEWTTTEHYYQAMKFPNNREYREAIQAYGARGERLSRFPQFAKQKSIELGLVLEEGWDGTNGLLNGRSHAVMRNAVSEKLKQFPEFARQLDDLPDDVIIVEAIPSSINSKFADKIWADGQDGSGTNHLGIIYNEQKLIRNGHDQQEAAQQAYDTYQAFNEVRCRQQGTLYDNPDSEPEMVPIVALEELTPGKNGDRYFRDNTTQICLVKRKDGGIHFTLNKKNIEPAPAQKNRMLEAFRLQYERPARNNRPLEPVILNTREATRVTSRETVRLSIQLEELKPGENGDRYFKDRNTDICLVKRKKGRGIHFTINRQPYEPTATEKAQMLAAYHEQFSHVEPLKKLGIFSRKTAHKQFLTTLKGTNTEKFLNWLENFYCKRYLSQEGPGGYEKRRDIESILKIIKVNPAPYNTVSNCLAINLNGKTLESIIRTHRDKSHPSTTWGWKIIQETFLKYDAPPSPMIEL